MKIYIMGSLRNPEIPKFANRLSAEGFEVFADWFAPGPNTDDYFRKYAKIRGWSYKEALNSLAARQVFRFDLHHLETCHAAVMLMPAGKSAHLELGYLRGRETPAYILFDREPKRYDIMTQFASDIFFAESELVTELKTLEEKLCRTSTK